jgi:uncharacterized protein (TIGR00251 family)
MRKTRVQQDDVVLDLVVQPRAARTGFAGWRANRARIRLSAPPLDGRANAALLAFLADEFDVPRSQVELLKGERSREKSVRIRGPARAPAWLTSAAEPGRSISAG